MSLSVFAPKQPWKKKRKQPERGLHELVAEYLDTSLPRPDAYWFPVPNGTHISSPAYRAMMHRTQQIKSGIPDIGVVFKGRSIWIELKSEKGRLEDSQKAAQTALTLAGAVCAVCRSVDDVEAFLGQLMPLKGKVQ